MAAALNTIGNIGGTKKKSTNEREWRIKETHINMPTGSDSQFSDR